MNINKNDMDDNNNNHQDNQQELSIKLPSDIGDTLATIIIDKIISNAVIASKVNQTYNTLNDHCFKYLTNFINPYLETTFIFYENGIEDIEYQNKQIYFNKKPLEKINSWDLIPEPETNGIDRYENSRTKIMKFRKYTDNKIEGVKESSFGFDIDEDNQYVNKNENSFNEKEDKEKEKAYDKNIKEKKIKDILNKENKDINNSNIKPKNQLTQSTKTIQVINKNDNQKKQIKIDKRKLRIEQYLEDSAPKKKEKEEILEISITDDLPKESYENVYSIINSSDENNRLRREREIQIEQRNALKLLEIEREKKAKQKLYRRIEKDFDSNRLTFDPNGKIINLRTINESLAGDFVYSRFKIKPEQNKKKELNELKDIVYPIQGKELNNTKEEKNEMLYNKEIQSKIEADISKIKVEKNVENKSDKNNNNNIKDKNKGSILPSGYNFDKFVPEVGVIVKGENEKEKKEGGFEYVKKFNKPSFNELSRFISESINMYSNNFSSYLNSNSDLNSNNRSINDYRKTDDNNYIGYKEEFNENNPLMQNVHKMNNNIKYFSPDLKKYKSLNIQSYNMNTRKRNLMNSYDRFNTDVEQYQSIQLSKNFEENNLLLKKIFDEPLTTNLGKNYLKSIDANNLNKMNYFEKAVLPFKKFNNKKNKKELKQIKKEKEMQQKKSSDEAYINKFNSQIINNKNWGKEEEDSLKAQEKLREEMENEYNPKNNIRLPRINNHRMKNLGMQIMADGNNPRKRKMPVFGGNLK